MLLAQIDEGVRAAERLKDSFGLAVTVLIGVVLLLLVVIWLISRGAWRMVHWAKPKAEALIDSHMTMVNTIAANDTKRTGDITRLADEASKQTTIMEMQDEKLGKLDEMHQLLKNMVMVRTDSITLVQKSDKKADPGGG